MGFPFGNVCDLLDDLEKGKGRASAVAIQKWFKAHQGAFRNPRFDGCALLSTLLPEKRPDRVYGIQEARLTRIFGRAQGLGRKNLAELREWKKPGATKDLADKIEEFLRTQPQPEKPVGVQDVDGLLDDLALEYRKRRPKGAESSPDATSTPEFEASRASRANRVIETETPLSTKTEDRLMDLFRRLPSREAKWFARLLLKKPVELDANAVLSAFHQLLPSVLRIQDNLVAALEFLREESQSRSVIQGPLAMVDIAKVRPRLGIKVGRQHFHTGRSIKHCLQMGYGSMNCQQKMDGEYAQIHINLNRGHDSIQIFSKSGKDSTADRFRLHPAIRESLRLGEVGNCMIREGCILEGELVVYSDTERRILSFDEIRKHVPRHGVYIGTAKDDRPNHGEHLMIVYFDLLYVDGQSLLHVKLSERLKRLEELVVTKEGHASVVQREVIDFGVRGAASALRLLFGKSILARREGLVLKPDDPYFDFSSSRRRFSCSSIKLKGGYLKGFGELGDFAVVGARYDVTEAKAYDIDGLRFTHFYIGCLRNKEAVVRWARKPRFLITNVVTLNKTQLTYFLRHASHGVEDAETCTAFDIDHHPGVDGGRRLQYIFTNPPVFDVYCFDFHTERRANFMTPRFPQVKKIHCDRNFRDALTELDLQDLVGEWERQVDPEGEDDELQEVIQKLKRADPGGVAVDAETQRTTSTAAKSTPELSAPDSTPLQTLDSQGASSAVLRSPGHTAAGGLQLPPHSAQAAGLRFSEVAAGVKHTQKRLADLPIKSPRRTKKIRGSSSQLREPGTPLSSPTMLPPASSPRREPLKDITANSQERDNSNTTLSQQGVSHERASFRESAGVMDRVPSSPSSFQTAPSHTPSPPRSTLPSSPPVAGAGLSRDTRLELPTSAPAMAGATTDLTGVSPAGCDYLGKNCVFYGKAFLLSPCVANMPYLTEDLLAAHGAQDTYTDIATWHQARCARRTIVLVEGRRKSEDTKTAFLKEIEAVARTLPNGAKERVEVLDWRVLEEALAAEETQDATETTQGAPLDRHRVREMWRKHWVGLA